MKLETAKGKWVIKEEREGELERAKKVVASSPTLCLPGCGSPPVLGLWELVHIPLGWMRKQGREASLFTQCFLGQGSSGQSSCPQPD